MKISTLLVVLASSTSGNRLLGIVSLCRPPPHRDRGRARAAGNRFARDDKESGPQLGAKQLPGERPRDLPRRDTRALSPAGMFRGKAPLSGAEEQRCTLYMRCAESKCKRAKLRTRFEACPFFALHSPPPRDSVAEGCRPRTPASRYARPSPAEVLLPRAPRGAIS